MQRLIVTGSTGYIGTRLIQLALDSGYEVIALTRSTSSVSQGSKAIAWELGQELPRELQAFSLSEAALIHLAHDWTHDGGTATPEGHKNCHGTKILMNSALHMGVKKFVFVSSQSARADALNIYGRTKWRIEQAIVNANTVSARVGLVYGGPRQGMFGLLNRLVSRLPILPMVSPNQLVQPIHLDEVCNGLIRLADSDLSGVKALAGPTPVRFGDVLRILAHEIYARRLIIIPLPLFLILFAARLTKYIPLIPTIDPERILGLAGTLPMPCADDLAEIGLDILPIQIGLRRSPYARRSLLVEGKTLLSYVLGHAPSSTLLRRYVKALYARDAEIQPISFLPIFIAWPSLIRFIEPLTRTTIFAQRLHLATHLVDASADGTENFYRAEGQFSRLARLLLWVIGDLITLPFRLLTIWVMR